MSKAWLVGSGQTGIAELPAQEIRFIGASELFGAIGLIAPWATHTYPVLTPLAAACLGVVMILASRVHARLREPKNVALNVAILAICAFVVYGRLHLAR